jgi:stress-induced-phosphoprotein 1
VRTATNLGLGDASKPVEAYEKGLALEPSNEALKVGSGFGRRRQDVPGPELWTKVAYDPTTCGYLDQHGFVSCR